MSSGNRMSQRNRKYANEEQHVRAFLNLKHDGLGLPPPDQLEFARGADPPDVDIRLSERVVAQIEVKVPSKEEPARTADKKAKVKHILDAGGGVGEGCWSSSAYECDRVIEQINVGITRLAPAKWEPGARRVLLIVVSPINVDVTLLSAKTFCLVVEDLAADRRPVCTHGRVDEVWVFDESANTAVLLPIC